MIWKKMKKNDFMSEIYNYGIRKIDTPLGIIYAISSEKGIIKITSKKQIGNDSIGKSHLDKTEKWFDLYFNGEEIERPPLDYQEMTVFRKKVLNKLMEEITFGKIISYGELANLLKNERASRAVGTALGKNPWSIIVPCHRVVNSNKKIGNYSGIKNNIGKKFLLTHEGFNISENMMLIDIP
ncbi:MAG: cysteine methyltransferase [Euryarchaeota archaeon]|nr:cysteine methyltransferase [Euryarchaeota archaeon]|tara:strand:+ start:30146 stop:30691 length:546 start_codon:yes stop_codon:yes gene_type:complete